MKAWFIIFVIAGGVYWYVKSPASIDVLMQPAGVDVNSEFSGIQVLTSEGGSGFDVTELAEPGLITIVEFYTASCPGCKLLREHYQWFLKARPDVAVRRVRMPGSWTPTWAREQFGQSIGATPHILIFDRQGRLLAADRGMNKNAFDMLYEWLNRAKRQAR